MTLSIGIGDNGSCTRIDNIFASWLAAQQNLDHYPLRLHNHSDNRSNFVIIRGNSNDALEALLSDLQNINIMFSVNISAYGDPNANYNIIHNHLMNFKDKPVKSSSQTNIK